MLPSETSHVRPELRAGVDLPWQEVFGTTNRSEVEGYCRAANLQFEWRSNGRLRTHRVAPAILLHPYKGTELWFNHAHLFHVSNLEPTLKESLLREFGEEDLPEILTMATARGSKMP